MLRFHDRGIWTWVEGVGPNALAEVYLLQSMLMMPCTEPGHEWWYGDGYIHYMRQTEEGYFYFLRGFAPTMKLRLEAKKIQVEHYPEQWWPRNYNPAGYEHVYWSLRNDIQRWACTTMISHREGIYRLPTRFGKTYTTAAAYVGYGRPQTLVLVPRTSIISKAIREMSEFLQEPIGHICTDVGPANLQNLTYASPASVVDSETNQVRPEYAAWLSYVEFLLHDENHISGTQARIIHYATANRQIQMATSATPFTDDAVKNEDAYGFFGPVRIDMEAKQAADLGLLAQMVVRMYTIEFERRLVELSEGVGYNDYLDTMVLNNPVVNNQIKLIAEHHIAAGDKVAIFVDRIKHADTLHEIIPDSARNAGPVRMTAREKTLQDFNEGELMCVVTTKSWREGVTLHCDVIINAEGLHAEHVQQQKFGRGMLLKESGKPLLLYDFFYKDKPRDTLGKQSRQRKRTYTKGGWDIEDLGTIEVSTGDVLSRSVA